MVTSGRKFGMISGKSYYCHFRSILVGILGNRQDRIFSVRCVEIVPDLHQTRIVVSEMIHFVYQLQYYYLFEARLVISLCVFSSALFRLHWAFFNYIDLFVSHSRCSNVRGMS